MESIVIVGAKRTPIGALQGKFNNVTASELGATAIKAAVEQAGVKPQEVDDLIFGCVLQAGPGQAPARQAALEAGVQNTTPATKVNKKWGPGMKGASMAWGEALTRKGEIVVTRGEVALTASRAPMPHTRSGRATEVEKDSYGCISRREPASRSA